MNTLSRIRSFVQPCMRHSFPVFPIQNKQCRSLMGINYFQQTRSYVSERKMARQKQAQEQLDKKYSSKKILEQYGYEATIGLEVHAQIKSLSKLFSGASTRFATSHPNRFVSLVDAAFPGTLPVINEYCVRQAVKTGIALQGNIETHSQFDRKHYFYADMPQGYQITQQFKPIVKGGKVHIELADGTSKEIRLQRIQIEQDSGKSLHDQDPNLTLVDLNRAGIGLMEIISHPDINSSEEAEQYIKKLQFLLKYIATCDGNMAEGSLRCDINISVHKPGTPLGTRCEVKNVASFNFIVRAIDYEIKRQIKLIEKGGNVQQETRLFDARAGKTIVMRTKENAPDYRFIPDPDLPPLVLNKDFIEKIKNELQELPDEIQYRLSEQYGISKYEAFILLVHHAVPFFEEIVNGTHRSPKIAVTWILNELFELLNKDDERSITQSPVSPKQLGSIVDMIENQSINAKIGRNVLNLMYQSDNKNLLCDHICEEKGWKQITSREELLPFCRTVVQESPIEVEKFLNEQSERVIGFLISKVLKSTNGRANPKMVDTLIRELIQQEKTN